jgi:DNA-binding LytR/AlgR family response regulator
MTLNVLISDFSADEAGILQKCLIESKEYHIHSEICNIAERFELLLQQLPEMVFLNIDALGNQVGAVTKRIFEISVAIRVVFVSENNNYSAVAFEMNVYDYILKPLCSERILKTLARLHKELKTDVLPVIPVWKNDRFVVLKPEQIVYCYTVGNKTLIKSKDGEYTCLSTLCSFEQKLSNLAFFRTHKSFLVNLEYIKEIIPWFNHTYHLVMNLYEKDEIPVSRTHLKGFKNRMGIE